MALRRVGNEIDVLRRLSHPGILRLERVLHTENFLYIVTERGGPDLFDFFEAHPEKFSSTVARKIMMGILNPIAFCHANGVCHRDLKPENVLLQSHTNKETKEIDVRDIKLCDFGLCETVRDGELLDDFCGSPGFFAPEIVTAKKHDGKLTDIWSLGCILAEMLFCIKPDGSQIELEKRVMFKGDSCYPLSPRRDGSGDISKKDQMSRIMSVLGQPSNETMSFLTTDQAKIYLEQMT